jgi:hypothetical protein
MRFNSFHSLGLLLAFLWVANAAQAQQRGSGYEISGISPSVVRTPDYDFSGDKKPGVRPRNWLEVEVEFRAEPEMTEELTVKYYILVNKTLFVGETTHVNIAKGRERRSVMYIAPNTLERLMEGKPFNASAIENVGVELLKQGQLVAVKSLKDSRVPWWQQFPQTTGYVLNKNDTPFAPLYWDRYEAIKPNSR